MSVFASFYEYCDTSMTSSVVKQSDSRDTSLYELKSRLVPLQTVAALSGFANSCLTIFGRRRGCRSLYFQGLTFMPRRQIKCTFEHALFNAIPAVSVIDAGTFYALIMISSPHFIFLSTLFTIQICAINVMNLCANGYSILRIVILMNFTLILQHYTAAVVGLRMNTLNFKGGPN